MLNIKNEQAMFNLRKRDAPKFADLMNMIKVCKTNG